MAASDPVALTQIAEALDRCYPPQRSLLTWRTNVAWRDGGPDPLDQVLVFVDPRGFLTYVGLGLAELDDKRSPNLDVSGFGFELSLRLAIAAPVGVDLRATELVEHERAALTACVPFWPVGVLNRLARYVFDSKRRLVHGDYMHLRGAPFHEWLGFADDLELGEVDTVHGRFAFRQVFPLADAAAMERLAAAEDAAATDALLGELRARDPHLCWRAEHGPPAPAPAVESSASPGKPKSWLRKLFG